MKSLKQIVSGSVLVGAAVAALSLSSAASAGPAVILKPGVVLGPINVLLTLTC